MAESYPEPRETRPAKLPVPRTPAQAFADGDIVFNLGDEDEPVRIECATALTPEQRASVAEFLDWLLDAKPDETPVRPAAEWHSSAATPEAREAAQRELTRVTALAHRGRS